MVTKKSWAYVNREFLGEVAFKAISPPSPSSWNTLTHLNKEVYRRVGEEVADATLGKFNKEFRALLAQPPKTKRTRAVKAK